MAYSRVAVVQAATSAFDSWGAVELVEKWTRKAAKEGAQLVVFPESFIGGYPKGSDFGAVVGQRTPEGREAFRVYFESAIAVPGPQVERLTEIARNSSVYMIVGVIEREGNTLYCSILTISPQGSIINKRRKLMGVGTERLLFGWGDGSTLNVLETPLGLLGTLMCWENLMPAARMALYGQGIQIYCAPTAVGSDVDIASARHIAREGRCFVLAAHLLVNESSFPNDYPPLGSTPAERIRSSGGSAIVGPNGEVLEGPIWDDEALLVADVDLDEIVRWKYDFDVTGHFARPDLFTLNIDRTRRPVVVDRGVFPKGAPSLLLDLQRTED